LLISISIFRLPWSQRFPDLGRVGVQTHTKPRFTLEDLPWSSHTSSFFEHLAPA
jgi:hypothetical protein